MTTLRQVRKWWSGLADERPGVTWTTETLATTGHEFVPWTIVEILNNTHFYLVPNIPAESPLTESFEKQGI